jgi:hypothetical protein
MSYIPSSSSGDEALTVIFRIVYMGMIHDSGGAGIESLHRAAELAPEDVNGLEARVG